MSRKNKIVARRESVLDRETILDNKVRYWRERATIAEEKYLTLLATIRGVNRNVYAANMKTIQEINAV
jgi:hypothetical protein